MDKIASLIEERDSLREALKRLVKSVSEMKNPQTTEHVANMVLFTIGPSLKAAQKVLGQEEKSNG